MGVLQRRLPQPARQRLPRQPRVRGGEEPPPPQHRHRSARPVRHVARRRPDGHERCWIVRGQPVADGLGELRPLDPRRAPVVRGPHPRAPAASVVDQPEGDRAEPSLGPRQHGEVLYVSGKRPQRRRRPGIAAIVGVRHAARVAPPKKPACAGPTAVGCPGGWEGRQRVDAVGRIGGWAGGMGGDAVPRHAAVVRDPQPPVAAGLADEDAAVGRLPRQRRDHHVAADERPGRGPRLPPVDRAPRGAGDDDRVGGGADLGGEEHGTLEPEGPRGDLGVALPGILGQVERVEVARAVVGPDRPPAVERDVAEPAEALVSGAGPGRAGGVGVALRRRSSAERA